MESNETKELYEAIGKRIAIREYDSKVVPSEICDKIDAFISKINKEEDLFKSKTRLLLMREDFSRIYTFGFIGGTKYWICGCTDKEDLSEAGFGYKMEKVILYATSLGLGTCWLGGTFTTSCYTKALKMDEANERMICVSPVGYKNPNKKGLISYFAKRTRNEWSKNFFFENPNTPMTEDKCTFFSKDIIEAIRFLPTAINRQDYAVVFNKQSAHVYRVGTSQLSLCDGGIAMAHVEIACLGSGKKGHWERLENPVNGVPNNWGYLGSYICE